MKKQITLFVLVISTFFSHAQQISIDTVGTCIGDTILVPVQMSNVSYLGAITLFIEYNGVALDFDTVVNINAQTDGLIGNGMQNPTRVGLVWSAFASAVNFTAGKLCDLRFIYNGGTTSLTVSSNSEIADYDGIAIAMNYTPGQVHQSFLNINFTGLDTVYCENSPSSLLVGSPVGGVFSGPGISGDFFNPALATAGTHEIVYTYTDGNNCVFDISHMTTVYAMPTVSLGNNIAVCEGNSVTLNAGQFESYAWSGGEVSQQIAVTLSGTYTVTVTDAYGCTNSDDVTVAFNPLPQVNLGNDMTVCADESVLLNAGQHFAYFWSNGSISQSVNVLPGDYSVTVIDGNTCQNSDSISISAYPALLVSYISENCTPDYANYSVLFEIFGGDPASYSVIDNATGLSTGTLIGGLFESNLIASATAYSFSVFDANGCDTILVEGFHNCGQTPTLVVDLGPDQILCEGQTATLNAGVFDSYLWSNGETNQNIDVMVGGSYSVTVGDGLGNTGSDTVSVIFNPIPVVDLGPDTSFCEGETYILDAGFFDNYIWSTGATTESITIANTGTYSVTVTNTNGCTGSDQVSATFNPLPVVDLGPDVSSAMGNIVNLSAGSFTNYLWSTGETGAMISVSATGNYTVTVSDINGCEGSDEIFVEFLPVAGSPPIIYSMSPANNTLLENWHNVFVATHDVDNDVEYLEVFVVKSTFPGDSSNWISWDVPVSPTDLATFNSNYSGVLEATFTAGVFKLSINTLAPADTSINFPGWGEGTYTFWYIAHDSYGLQSSYWGNSQSPVHHRIYLIEEVIISAQLISLDAGFSIFSTYINPIDPNIAAVLDSITSEIMIVKDGIGNPYWPQFGFNNIGNMQIGRGYLIKLYSAQDVWVVGELIDPMLNPINVPAGWSLLGYLRTGPASMVDMLQGITSNIVLVKNHQGQVYWPGFNLNLIGNMAPGEGYKIKMLSAATLTYPANTANTYKASVYLQEPVHFNCEKASGNMTLGIPLSAWELIPEYGDEIGVFSNSGKLTGSTVFDGKDMAIAIWGLDDQLKKEGMKDNESYYLQHWNKKTGAEAQITVDYFEVGDALYESDKISVVGRLKMEDTPFLNVLYECYPNPANQVATVSFQIDRFTLADVFLADESGKNIKTIVERRLPAGNYSIEVDVDKLPSGNYFIIFKSDRLESTQKLMVVH